MSLAGLDTPTVEQAAATLGDNAGNNSAWYVHAENPRAGRLS